MERADAIILGGGLVGATLALGLDAHGLTSIVVDPADPAKMLAAGFDGRASAVASASGRMLDAIGIGARLAGQGCAIRAIRVSDGLAPGSLDFTPDEGDGADQRSATRRSRLHRLAPGALRTARHLEVPKLQISQESSRPRSPASRRPSARQQIG